MLEENKSCWLLDRCNHIDCNNFCVKRWKLNYLYENALVSMEQRKHMDLKLDTTYRDKAAFERLANISNNIEAFVNEGNNLYIHSNITGNGKSKWALRLLQSYFNKIWFKSKCECKALFINVPRLLIALKNNLSMKDEYAEHIKENILNCNLVIWDEIGTKAITPFEAENLLSMLNTRIENKKSNIFTSNLSSNELHQYLGDRLYSRIINASIEIEFFESDKRCLMINNNY